VERENLMPVRAHHSRGPWRAYTLVEVLVVVSVLGIAAAMVTPTFSQTGVLRVQAAIRTVVSDISTAQSDAIAYQKGRGILFTIEDDISRYRYCEVNGTHMDQPEDLIKEQKISDAEYGNATFENINIPNGRLVFDELGGPVTEPGGSTPASAQSIDIVGSGQRFRIHIHAYSGRVTVESLPLN
jgi:prepilin-type N-terminal cleavage/methylation domain-containing protein